MTRNRGELLAGAAAQPSVLVVDDEIGVRTVIRRTLEGRGHRVLEATSAEDALAIAEHERAAVDLVIADLMLPNLSGFELFQRLEERWPGLRGLYISGYVEDHAHLTLDPGVAFLHKPFGTAELLEQVARLMERRTSASPISRPGPLVAPGELATPDPASAPRRGRLLVAAPNPSEARFIGNYLEAAADQRVRVDAASTPDGARRMAYRRRYDLMVVDLELAGRDASLLDELSAQASIVALAPGGRRITGSRPPQTKALVPREGAFLGRLADEVRRHAGLAAPPAAAEPRRRDHLETICHDLRNPASTILGFSDVLLDESALPLAPQQRSALMRIRRNAAFLLDLVGSIMDSERLDSGEMPLRLEQHDLGEILRETVEDFRVKAEAKQIELVARVPEAPVVVEVDRQRMERVIGNLLSNALKFSFPGTAVEAGVRPEDDCTVLWVKDQGQGIPEQERGRLFRKFGRTSVGTTQGEHQTGLGLYIVKNILDLHGASIEVESAIGAGTTFRISLPDTR